MKAQLIRNYVAIADGTQQVKSNGQVRKHRSWSWNPAHKKPSRVKNIPLSLYMKGTIA